MTDGTRQNANGSFSTGLWKKLSKTTSKPYVGGSFQNYWVNYYPNRKAGDIGEPDGFLYLYEKVGKDVPREEHPKPVIVNMYVRVSKNGLKYVAGKRGKRFMIFTNTKKSAQSPNAPDYNLMVADLDDAPKTTEVKDEPEMPGNEIEDPGFIKEPEEKEEDVF